MSGHELRAAELRARLFRVVLFAVYVSAFAFGAVSAWAAAGQFMRHLVATLR